MKLNQIIALGAGKKTRFAELLTETHHKWGKGKDSPLFGLRRTYKALDDDGEKMPTESRRVQTTVRDKLKRVVVEAKDFYDVVCCHEKGNAAAGADVVIDGTPILADVPVGFLLFLEKQLVDLHTLLHELPVLPSDREWGWDSNKGCYVAAPEQTHRTQKVAEPIVLYDATPEHPAQTQMIMKDVCVGHWTAVHMSGAIPAQDKADAIERIRRLQDAVKMARAEANSEDVGIEGVSGKLLNFVFQPMIERRESVKT